MVCSTEITGHLLTNNDIGNQDKGHFSCLKIFQVNETMRRRREDDSKNKLYKLKFFFLNILSSVLEHKKNISTA